jgi:hypothetical protein
MDTTRARNGAHFAWRSRVYCERAGAGGLDDRHLSPPPVEPGGFDFQHVAWFEGSARLAIRTPVWALRP